MPFLLPPPFSSAPFPPKPYTPAEHPPIHLVVPSQRRRPTLALSRLITRAPFPVILHITMSHRCVRSRVTPDQNGAICWLWVWGSGL